MVGDIQKGHNGKFAYIIVRTSNGGETEKISFSLEKPIWLEEESETISKGDWVVLERIRYHGKTGEGQPQLRAYKARYATKDDFQKFKIEPNSGKGISHGTAT